VPEDAPEQIQLPVVWTGADDVPILYINAFVAQFDADLGAHILTLGQLTPPALVGTPDEIAEQVAELEFVTIKTVARLAITPAKMQEVIGSLQANVDQRERAATLRPGDPRE
jgi:hypothetical protein